jgi:hypothetical protein
MYFYLTCSISYGVNLYLDLRNINKFKFKQHTWTEFIIFQKIKGVSNQIFRKVLNKLEIMRKKMGNQLSIKTDSSVEA